MSEWLLPLLPPLGIGVGLGLAVIAVERWHLGRWALWTTRCRRGRRCARLEVEAPEAPAGTAIRTTYVCGGCGTRYRHDLLVGRDGAYTELDRERVP